MGVLATLNENVEMEQRGCRMLRAWDADDGANEPRFTFEEVTDPAEIARSRAQDERAQRNSDWLKAHWSDVLPQARGKFLAVAGQEAFVADTPEQAWSMARAAHPEDDGVFCQYVRPGKGPRIYAHHR